MGVEEDKATSDAADTAELEQSSESQDTASQEGGLENQNQESGPISDEERKRYGIPEKFKDWKSVVIWGSEAEKAKSKAENEKSELSRKITEYEDLLAEAGEEKESKKDGKPPKEEVEALNAKFIEDWAANPVGTLQGILDQFLARMEGRRQHETLQQKWEKEEADLSGKPEYKDKWLSEIKPALVKIAKERPYLQTIEEALAVYERQRGQEERFNKAEADRKKTEKKSALSEDGRGGGPTGDLAKKIASAKSIEELEALGSKIGA